MWIRISSLLALLLLLPSCATTETTARPEARLTMMVRTKESLGGAELLARVRTNAVFPALRGSIWGDATKEDVFVLPAAIGQAVSVDLNQWSASFASLAELPTGPRMANVSVEPRSTHLVRVGTFLQDAGNKRIVGAGFRDISTHRTLVLVYFDRACRLKGWMPASDHKTELDFSVPHKGFVWLQATGMADSTNDRLTLADPVSAVEFVVVQAIGDQF